MMPKSMSLALVAATLLAGCATSQTAGSRGTTDVAAIDVRRAARAAALRARHAGGKLYVMRAGRVVAETP